jgi:NDP-sugar pyrophosphorylase family protein
MVLIYLGSFSYVGENTVIGDNVKFIKLFYWDNVVIKDNVTILRVPKFIQRLKLVTTV